ncbi:uncharacterized protein NESG_02056 [Nematocida ausubeli]|uniref:Uncharacterized protein n=1 Tax=Nematocida ausubeli (strain ATCC PRA-371 / ERTm2) TaxID=1913371 RepID=H8ZBX4_NEMA1|nr:uncharacterized protein NESG_02056 [Nematocida ausubeli]EHY65610.1 hypothetical protein NERG_01217 [Nematocida ausubeli]KAI5139877.1 hypothetical protein NEAUS07_2670 [Nematocida ausubeli]KFG25285.1 hypothetical protein NESG_02056 [Nematocida ausubeli]
MDRIVKVSSGYPVLRYIESATNNVVRPEYSFIAIVAVLFISLFCRSIASAITNVLSIAFIVHSACSAICTKGQIDIASAKHIISYLLTLNILITAEYVVYSILYIPVYYHIKIIFMYYLSNRRSRLTEYINNVAYTPLNEMIRHVQNIDIKKDIKTAQMAASEKLGSITKDANKEEKTEKKEDSPKEKSKEE